jgi:colicin import membrane protein
MDAPNSEANFAVAPTFTPAALLQDGTKVDQLIATIEAELEKQRPDTSTKKGREAIASFAYKISRTKTAIDDAGADAVKGINAVRKKTALKLDELRDKARQPLTEWEAADEKRVADCNVVIDMLRGAARVPLTAKSADVAETLAKVEAVAIDADTFRELAQLATDLRATAITDLQDAIKTLQAREQQDEELARLKRAEAAAPKAAPKQVDALDEALQQQRALQEEKGDKAAEDVAITRAEQKGPQVDQGKQPEPQSGPTFVPNRRAVFAESIAAIEKAGGVDTATAVRIVLAIAAKQIPNITSTI